MMKTQEQTGKKERITICLEAEQVVLLDQVCGAVDCSRSWFLAQLVEKADLNALIQEYDPNAGPPEKTKL